MFLRALAIGTALAGGLAIGPALAQQATTSGPATGTDVKPSTAVQKQEPATTQSTTGSTTSQAAKGALGAGAPGVEAKPGTEAGKAPQKQ